MMRLFKYMLPFLGLMLSFCSTQPNADTIINKTIEKHGGDAYQDSRIVFTFRGTEYTAKRQGGEFVYTRMMVDSAGVIVDSLSNKGLYRSRNGDRIEPSMEDSSAYSNSVNSVIYFAKLPFQLNDAAVNKELLGETTINGEPYYEIKVTFDQEGGGTDFEDIFVYWIHRDDYTMDYLSYRFHVDGGGTRFREAYNVRTVNGIRFADYINYGGPDMERPLQDYDTYFEADTLEKVSEINLDKVEVELLNEDN